MPIASRSTRLHGWKLTMANIASLALRKMLHRRQHRARRLCHSLASALWARQLAHMLARETGKPAACLHNIGRAVALGACTHRRGAGIHATATNAIA